MEPLTAVADWIDGYFYGNVDREVVVKDAVELIDFLRQRNMQIVLKPKNVE